MGHGGDCHRGAVDFSDGHTRAGAMQQFANTERDLRGLETRRYDCRGGSKGRPMSRGVLCVPDEWQNRFNNDADHLSELGSKAAGRIASNPASTRRERRRTAAVNWSRHCDGWSRKRQCDQLIDQIRSKLSSRCSARCNSVKRQARSAPPGLGNDRDFPQAGRGSRPIAPSDDSK